MSQLAAVSDSGHERASRPEKDAMSEASPMNPSTAPTSTSAPKLRSCVVCRARKVRCDKQSPCSNCRRANIACILPPTDRPPRWARRLDRIAKSPGAAKSQSMREADPGVDKVMDRLHTLEALVKELRGQLEQAATHSASGDSSEVHSPESSTQHHDADHHIEVSSTNETSLHKQFGRMVLQDASRSRYVSSGFWSRVDDELDGLKMDAAGLAGDDSDSSEDEASPGMASSTQESERAPSERHAFLFRHNLGTPAVDLGELQPLPSQIPFLLDVFTDNVNMYFRIVHRPTVAKMVRDLRGRAMTHLSPSNEALMFSIYYAAVISMEEDDVMTNFGSHKSDLSLKYRLGLEHALAKADFLNAPDIILVQAFAIFLCLARRHDSPRFVYMMTGLLIRMAQYLGLQRDGAHFEHLTPFEVEMRRRTWWVLCLLDMRASEDQGMDLTITSGSFDTKIPLNINESEIDPETKHTPVEHYGVTDLSFARISAGIVDVMRQMMVLSIKEGVTGLQEQSRLIKEIYRRFELEYFQHTTDSGNIAYWVSVTIARLVMAKMTLIVFLPVLFASPNEHISDEIRNKLLISAIEVAEYNHALNAEEAARQWRWIYQTHTHWHSIVLLLIEISRRPWSPTLERAWVALHSSWLIPARTSTDKNSRIWIPLRKLMDKVRRHRDAEIDRLRADPDAAASIEAEDEQIPRPSSSGPFPAVSTVDFFRERWRQLVTRRGETRDNTQTPGDFDTGLATHQTYTNAPATNSLPLHTPSDTDSNLTFQQNYPVANVGDGSHYSLESSNTKDAESAAAAHSPIDMATGQSTGFSYDPFPAIPADWSDGRSMGPGFVPWLWADSIDVNMDVNNEVDWYDWVKSASVMELDSNMPPGNNQS